ncbi:hypothetical protein I6I99_11045 [Sphingobacterium multivorum]|nr:hypothetical protein [Sphingobacterium multivorum]QQT33063.1 hypothetical protein I6I99_11045 [Sphingobacterium multivorum]
MNNEPRIKRQIQENFDALIKYRKTRRAHEEIISDITEMLKKVRKEAFLPFLMQMLNSIQFRDTLEAFKNLKSPQKQIIYLIDLFFSIESSEIVDGLSNEEWNKLTKLLDEVEMTYFGEIGFFDEETDNFHRDKVSVSLKAFFDYYSNGNLSYDEQTLNRLKTNFEKFDDEIFNEFSFKTQDMVQFYLSLQELLQNKADKCFHFHQNPKEWRKLTSKFLARGLNDPKDWAAQPELSDMIGFMSRPGYIFIVNRNELSLINLDSEILSNIIKFLKYDELRLKDKTFYYSDESQFSKTPIIQLNDDEFLFPNGKFVLEAFYNRINTRLSETKKEKYTQFKNKMLEKKTYEVFRSFFPKEAIFFDSFYFDKQSKSEQDLAILFRGTLLIIEIKDFKFRAPMRNPISAFDKIRSDFKGGIQKAYDQCKRLEQKLEIGENFKIYDLDTKKEIYEINPKEIKAYYSIIVTQHKYGGIQTNLHELLSKENEDLYPWSVCIDDLEIFLCLLNLNKGSKINRFLEFLDYREAFHERLICSDELEMCGYFITSNLNFKKFANQEEILTTDIKMSSIFDAHYECGLGLPNETNFTEKRKRKLRKYAKNFNVTIISGNDLDIGL